MTRLYDRTLTGQCRSCHHQLSEVDDGFVNCGACRAANRERARTRRYANPPAPAARAAQPPRRRGSGLGLDVFEPFQALTLEAWRRREAQATAVHFVGCEAS